MIFLLILSAVIPPILVAYVIYYADRYERESYKDLILPFVGGMLIVPIAYFIENSITDYFEIDLNNELHTLGLSFIGISLVEEGLKTIVFLSLVFNWKFFDEAFDGFVYAIMIGMGFALVENILYVWELGISTALIRAFTAVPAHAVFAMVLGYFFAKAKFDKQKRYQWIFTGFILTVFIHGLYDFLILQTMSEPLMAGSAVLIYGLAIACWIVLKKVLKESQAVNEAPAGAELENPNPKINNDDLTDEIIKEMKDS